MLKFLYQNCTVFIQTHSAYMPAYIL